MFVARSIEEDDDIYETNKKIIYGTLIIGICAGALFYLI
jgi:hypothetical protein